MASREKESQMHEYVAALVVNPSIERHGSKNELRNIPSAHHNFDIRYGIFELVCNPCPHV